MDFSLTKLEYDSNLFGYKTGLLQSDEIKVTDDLKKIYSIANKQGFRLIYFKTKTELTYGRGCSNKIILTDRKVTYFQNLIGSALIDISPNLHLYSKIDINKDLLAITLQSGIYSRFATDPNFKNGEYEKLYTEWIRKSILREIAYEVWISENYLHKINGLITLGIKDNLLDIGLLAVDVESRGLKIGTQLIELAKCKAVEWGKNQLQVVTQLDNYPACNFYSKCGFVIKEIEYIYHIWI